MGFKKNPPGTGKTATFPPFRCTPKEKDEIIRQAEIHGLLPSEYALRRCLGRRVDAKLETDMILELRDAIAALKALHAQYEKQGDPPPYDQLAPVMNAAIEAIRSLGRY